MLLSSGPNGLTGVSVYEKLLFPSGAKEICKRVMLMGEHCNKNIKIKNVPQFYATIHIALPSTFSLSITPAHWRKMSQPSTLPLSA